MKAPYSFLILVSILCAMCGSKSVVEPQPLHTSGTIAPIDSSSKEETIKPIAVSDLKEGLNLVRYDNGVKQYEGLVKNEKRVGKWAYWYANGSPWSECEYREGKKEGRTTVWYENGNKRYEGSYSNDQRSGKWTFWDEKGNVLKELTY